MKKLIIFDLDGVLIDSRELHFKVFNKALSNISKDFEITEKEHLTKYDGLSTNQKLRKLTNEKGLDEKLHRKIWEDKQELTFEALESFVKPNKELQRVFKYLKESKCYIAIASNSIRKTIEITLKNLGIFSEVDLIVSNEDVIFPKPNPQIYLEAMSRFGISPMNTYIFEDSYIGRKSAFESSANVFPVNNSTELTFNYVKSCIEINFEKSMKWVNKKLNILIPMAGNGSRFSSAGYELPKPLIDVNGKPMIQRVIENLNIEANYIFLVRKEHEEKYNVSSILKTFEPNCEIVFVESLTEGAACTTLLAKDLIDNSNPLFIANSDQLLEWNSCEFYHSVNSSIDGSILVFEGLEDKWSYVKTDLDGNVTEVAEKIIISNTPTCGLYYFNKGSDYVKYAEQMIDKNIRHGSSFNGRGEFYVAPVYNEYIKDSKIIKTFKVDKMIGLGTPEELQVHLNECQ